MSKTRWLGGAAVALALGASAAMAQTPPAASQRNDESPRAQAPAKDERPPAQERQKDRSAQDTDSKAGAKQAREPQRGDDKGAQQAQEPSRAQDSKQPSRQTQDQDRTQRPPADAAQRRDQDRQDAKQPADQKQQQSRDQQKQDNRAVDSKQPAETKQQQSQQPTQSNQAAQPAAPSKGDTAQDRSRDTNQGQAANQPSGSTSTTVSDQQRTDIRQGLSRDRAAIARETQNLNIQVNVGTQLPPRVRPRPLPPDIVRIAPQYRGYDYTVVEDEIVIVEPRTRRIVEVISEPGREPRMASRLSTDRQILTQDQRSSLKQIVHRASTTGSTSGAAFDSNCMTLQAVPEELTRANPDLGNYKMLAIGEQVVLIDPRERKVVEVVD